jgi:glycosyltransferase involved in cell wall biosynthesis
MNPGEPSEGRLTSILILGCERPAPTRRCVEGVLRWTRPPYELVLVDRGSDEATARYLGGLAARAGPARVEVVRSAAGAGASDDRDKALALARGDPVVLLDSNAAVSGGWLDRLTAWSRHDWPRVGLVGPVSNDSAPPQKVELHGDNPSGLDAFAARRRSEFAGKAVQVERLSGPCLLVRRAVLDRVGSFGDHDDLCARALAAGFRLLVALDVFVHRAAAPEAAGRPKVSLCLIVKDEEANLPECLGSAAGLADEVVVIDTGSRDRTREVAARAGARVFEFPWVDDFAAARNESLRHARGDWVLWLDADDRIDGSDRRKLRDLLNGLGNENAAYVMKCLCVAGPTGEGETVVDHVRLFRNDPRVRWEYRVHEQILPSIRRTGGEVRWSDVVIRHVGYCDPALRRRKLERDVRLLRLEDAARPDDPFTLFNLGSVYYELGQVSEALPLLKRSLARSAPRDSIVRKLYALIAQGHRRLGQGAEALAACREGRAHYPDDAELLFQEGLAARDLGDRAGAEACLLRLLRGREGEHFASIDPGLRGYKARHNLAVLYLEQGRDAEAEAEWRAALAARPDFAPAWQALGELYLRQKRWDELEAVAAKLGAGAVLLRARGHLARREFAAARALLEEAIARAPTALAPRVALSHAWLQEGHDPAAAERALRDVLALDPDHAEARHNLAVLLGRP